MPQVLTTPLACLVGFAMWAVALGASIGAVRSWQVVTRKKRSNEFPSGMQHGGDLYWRLNRAQINTTENLPIFASLVVAGTLSGVADPLFATLSVVVLCARVAQSLFHVSSGSVMAVNLRFTSFCVQLGCFAGIAWLVLSRT